MKSIGIDIGSYSIKVVEINSTAKGFQLVQFYTHPFSLKPNSDIHFEIIEFLRGLTLKYDPLNTKYILGLRQDKVAIRTKVFPFSDRNKIAKTLPLDLEEEIPFNIDNAIFDFKINKIVPPSAEILAFIVKKEAVEKCIQLLKECGINIDILSCEGSAYSNLLEKWDQPIIPLSSKISGPGSPIPEPFNDEQTKYTNKKLDLVLNIGHSQTLLTFYHENKLVAVRTILWGGKLVGEEIAKKFNLPLSEAHKELELKGFILTKKEVISAEAKTFSEIISKAVKNLIQDVQISILDTKSELNAEVSRIEITGGMSLIKGIGPYITQLLEMPCNKLRTLDHFSQVYFEKNDQNEACLGIAIGLAIEGLKKPRNPPINFLKKEFAKEDHRVKIFWSSWGPTIKLSIALIVVFYVWSFLRIDFSEALAVQAQKNLKTIAKKTMGVSAKNATKKNIEKYLNDNKKTISDLKSSETFYQMNSALEVLKKISDNLPTKTQIKLDVKKFEVNDQAVTLEGYVNSPVEQSLIKEYLKVLSTDEKIQSLNSTLPPIQNRVTFNFIFNIDRGITKER
ncbi:MAG: pilus assembly protein PilM [Deltaproteobacteria bacterium]|nr:pilus assembly protein PilM [Deltaproteobacteria bacterium]